MKKTICLYAITLLTVFLISCSNPAGPSDSDTTDTDELSTTERLLLLEEVKFPSFADIDPARSARSAANLHTSDEEEFIVIVANAVLEAMQDAIRAGTDVKQPFAVTISIPMGTDTIYEYRTSLQLVINNNGARFLGVFDLYSYPVGSPNSSTFKMENQKLEMNIEGFANLRIVSQLYDDWVWVMNYDYSSKAGTINQKTNMDSYPTTYTYKESQITSDLEVYKFVDDSINNSQELIWGTSEGIGYRSSADPLTTYMTYAGTDLGYDGSSLSNKADIDSNISSIFTDRTSKTAQARFENLILPDFSSSEYDPLELHQDSANF